MKTILKIAFDKCIVDKTRRGAAEAPDVIQGFVNIKDAIWKEIKIASDFETTSNNITKTVLDKDIIIGIGGDHSVSYGLMKAFSKKYPNIGLIVFDAHLDCESDFLPPDHEDILKAAVKEKLFKKMFVAGVRNYTKEQQEFAMKNFSWDSAKVSIDTIKQHIQQEVLEQVDNIYISIDIDVFDPEFAPGTGYPEKDGLKPADVLPIILDLAKTGKVKGFDIVEVCPKKDVNNKTSKLAAKILIDFLSFT